MKKQISVFIILLMTQLAFAKVNSAKNVDDIDDPNRKIGLEEETSVITNLPSLNNQQKENLLGAKNNKAETPFRRAGQSNATKKSEQKSGSDVSN